MKANCKKKVKDISVFEIPDHLKGIQLFNREQTASLLNISRSFLDLLPESSLVKIRIGKRVLYSFESINNYIMLSSGGNRDEK